MRVLGIDPGTIRMGYGVVDDTPKIVADDYGVVALSRSLPLEKRLYQHHTHILNMIHTFDPDAIAIEQPFIGKGDRQFVGSALGLGQAQAVVFIGAASQDIPLYRYSPAEIKMAVADYGRATKAQIQQIVTSDFGLDKLPSSDAADALAIGLCHIRNQILHDLTSMEISPGEERK